METTLRIVAESTFSVKIKAVWALANVTDALLLNAYVDISINQKTKIDNIQSKNQLKF